MTPDARAPAWSFRDLALMLGAVLPALMLGALASRLGKAVAPGVFASRAVEILVYQAVFYALMLGALYLVTQAGRQEPFWKSLGWTLRFRGVWWCLAAAPALMLALSALGDALRTPVIPNPWGDLISGQGSQLAILLFVGLIGPAWEELMFRGFLFPLLARAMGAWAAIGGAAIAFGLVHGAQNQWQWQYVLLVALSGVAFGYARHKTGSTAAAALMHAAYNSGLFMVFLVQKL
jgi:membrane protease YdiL (CAAX protease family)